MSHALIAFDTLKYANKLKDAGVSEAQANVQAEAMKEQNDTVQEFIGDTLATKQDMKRLEERLTDRLTARFCYMMVSGIGFLSALILILKFV